MHTSGKHIQNQVKLKAHTGDLLTQMFFWEQSRYKVLNDIIGTNDVPQRATEAFHLKKESLWPKRNKTASCLCDTH